MVIKPSDKRNFLISGSFIIILTVLSMVSVFFISGENNIFSTRINLHIVVSNAQNLKEGAAVQLKGIQVGTVSSIEFQEVDQLKITLGLDQNYQEWIREDSYVALKTQGVLGDMFVEILGGSSEAKIKKDGSRLKVQQGPSIDQFIGKGEDILVVAGRVLGRLDSILESVENKKISTILENIESSSLSTKKVMESLEKQNIGGLVSNMNKASVGLNNSLGSLDRITKRIENGPGTLHSLVYDRSVHDDLKTILGGTKRNKVLQYFIRESIKSND